MLPEHRWTCVITDDHRHAVEHTLPCPTACSTHLWCVHMCVRAFVCFALFISFFPPELRKQERQWFHGQHAFHVCGVSYTLHLHVLVQQQLRFFTEMLYNKKKKRQITASLELVSWSWHDANGTPVRNSEIVSGTVNLDEVKVVLNSEKQ